MTWDARAVKLTILVCSGLSAAGLIGGAVGYAMASKRAEKKYRDLATTEIAKARVFYQGQYSRPPLDPHPDETELDETERLVAFAKERSNKPDPIGEALSTTKRTYGPTPEKEQPKEQVVVNIFANHTPPGEEVMAALMAERDPAKPYIITKEEFYQNDPDNEQKAFTYYEGDDVLVDDQDEYNPVPDLERAVGEDNLHRFGYGSNDEHVVYVRNETIDPPLDFVITRTDLSYFVVVLGGDPDNEPPEKGHSKQKKFRHEDE